MSSLPEKPCLDQYRRRAKDLLRSARSGDSAALETLKTHHPNALLKPLLRLTDAQCAVARSEGFVSWPKLKSEVLAAEAADFFAELRSRDAESALRRLGREPELAKCISQDGETPLHVAAEHGLVALAEALVKAGADPQKKYGYSAHTALSWAITVGALDFARELVHLGDQPDLFSAAGLGDLPRVQGFWEGGKLRPNASKTGSSRFAPDGSRLARPPESDAEVISDAMVFACRSGEKDVAMWLVGQGADLEFRGYIGGAALHWAEYSGNQDLCAWLRESGASDEADDNAYLARPHAFGLIVPVSWGLEPRVRRFLDRFPGDVDITSGSGTPLMVAAHDGKLETANILLEFGADPGIRNAEGLTPSEIARAQGHEEVATLLAKGVG